MPLELGRRIDYILVRSNDHGSILEVAKSTRVFHEPAGGIWASDHFSVLADLTVQPEADSASEPRPASTERRITRTPSRVDSRSDQELWLHGRHL
jgi:hypothetical protein